MAIPVYSRDDGTCIVEQMQGLPISGPMDPKRSYPKGMGALVDVPCML